MPRRTVDIEGPILDQLKALGRREGRPLGQLISELVAEALAHRRAHQESVAPRLEWISKPMHAPVDWAGEDALDALLAREERERLARGAEEDRGNADEGGARPLSGEAMSRGVRPVRNRVPGLLRPRQPARPGPARQRDRKSNSCAAGAPPALRITRTTRPPGGTSTAACQKYRTSGARGSRAQSTTRSSKGRKLMGPGSG
jgi:hypothetical protein